MENNYCVYKHTVPNGKMYVGITKLKPLQRWAGGFGYSQNKLFFPDIVKYGWDNIAHEVLYENLNRYSAERIEAELIKTYNLTDCNFGYNQLEGTSGYKRPEYVKKQISKTMSKQKAQSVVQYDIAGNKIGRYESMREAERQTGVRAGNISGCCLGYLHTAGGYVWKYAKSQKSR